MEHFMCVCMYGAEATVDGACHVCMYVCLVAASESWGTSLLSYS